MKKIFFLLAFCTVISLYLYCFHYILFGFWNSTDDTFISLTVENGKDKKVFHNVKPQTQCTRFYLWTWSDRTAIVTAITSKNDTIRHNFSINMSGYNDIDFLKTTENSSKPAVSTGECYKNVADYKNHIEK
jgi:hypothetical protein